MKELEYIIICWILSFLIYGIVELINKKRNKKQIKNGVKRVKKGPSKTKEKNKM